LCLHGVLTLPSSPHDRLVPYTTLFRSTSAPNFGRLQHRLGRSGADAVAASSQVPAQLVVFDLLELDGNKLTSQPYTHRRQKLFRSEEHTSELQSRFDLVCRLLLEKKKQ